jgi:Holliday junction resolvase RusA-like endonuclease
MEKPVRFFVSCTPSERTHQACQKIFYKGKKVFRGVDKEGTAIKKMLHLSFLPYAPRTPFQGALNVEVDFVFPFRKAERKSVREKGQVPRTTKPDCDNLAKFVLDALEACKFFAIGDQQIAQLSVRKWWGDSTGIAVRVLPL